MQGAVTEGKSAEIDRWRIAEARVQSRFEPDSRYGLLIRRSQVRALVGEPRIQNVRCARTDGLNCGTRHLAFRMIRWIPSHRKAKRRCRGVGV